jgi:hypothetical protein
MSEENKIDFLNLKNYHESVTKEMLIKKDRVRNLVKHWGEEGKYKEAILKNMIKKFLPPHYLIGTGFIVKPGLNRGEHIPSSQIDLIIYNSTLPILFSEEDFVILTPETVHGIIEVKTNLENQDLTAVIHKMNTVGNFIYEGLHDFSNRSPIFNGVFSFEGFNEINNITLGDKIKKGYENIVNDNSIIIREYKYFLVNHICLNNNYFIKSWENTDGLSLSQYKLENLSFSYFISNLVITLCESYNDIRPDVWFPNDKEIYKEHETKVSYELIKGNN